MSEYVSQLRRMGLSDAASLEVAEKVAQFNAAYTNAADAYDAIIELLFIQYPHLTLTGNGLHVLLGRGTKSLAGERLTAFRIALNKRLAGRISHPNVPDEFLQRIGQVAMDMLQNAQDAAKVGFEAQRKAIEAEAAERVRRAEREAVAAKDAAQSAQEAQADAIEMARRAEHAREETMLESVALLERHEQTKHMLQQSEATAAQLREEIRSMREEAERQQITFTQQLELERAERTREREVLDGQIRFANQQIDAARQQTVSVRSQIDSMTKDRATMEDLHRQIVGQLRQQIQQLQQDTAQARERNGMLEAQVADFQQQATALQLQVGEIAPLQARVAELKGELERRESMIQQYLTLQAQHEPGSRGAKRKPSGAGKTNDAE